MTDNGPHSGGDTYDLVDDALYQLAERRHKWLGDPLAAITLLASLTGHGPGRKSPATATCSCAATGPGPGRAGPLP